MGKILLFLDFPVYKDAREFRKNLKDISTKNFPKEEQYNLTSQLWRALDSIVLNIAEGSERYSDMDFSRFLNTSLASVNEVVACLDCALDDEYIDARTYQTYADAAEKLIRQLKAFSSKVRKDGSINQRT